MTELEQNQQPPVQRVVTVFSNATEELVTEYPLINFDLAKFKERFQQGTDDEDVNMVACYEIQAKDVEFISGYIAKKHSFDFDKYCYFVEAYVSEEDWAKYYDQRVL